MSPGPTVLLRDVTVRRRGGDPRPLLREVSWEVVPGRITALVGPNGAGKTTTFHLLLGLLRPGRGSVTVDGEPPARWRRGHGVAFLPEERTPLPGWSAGLLLRAAGVHGDVEAHLRRHGLGGRARSPMDALSRGQARALLRVWALAGEPGLVLLDEPWSGLDPAARGLLAEELEALRRSGRTTLVSSHELHEVARIADEVLLLAPGEPARRLEGPLEADALERAARRPGGGR